MQMQMQYRQQITGTANGPQMMNSMGLPMQMMGEVGFDGKMLRKAMARKTVDYNPSVVNYLEVSQVLVFYLY